MFGVGVGSGYNEDEVNEIASDPDAIYSYALTEFSELASVLQDAIADQACTVSVDIPVRNIAAVLNWYYFYFSKPFLNMKILINMFAKHLNLKITQILTQSFYITCIPKRFFQPTCNERFYVLKIL